MLATRYIEDVRAENHERFDVVGMVLAGLGIAGVAFGLSILGLNFLPWTVVAALVVGGACFSSRPIWCTRGTPPIPALDLTLFRLPTFRASVLGGFMFRLGIGALPFLLPLMLQVGFGMTPFQSGMITFASALGAMGMKMAAATVLQRFGFRTILVTNALVSAAFLAACAAFTQTTPVAAMLALLLVGGFFRSLQFTSINTIAYAEVEPPGSAARPPWSASASNCRSRRGWRSAPWRWNSRSSSGAMEPLAASDFPPAFLAVAAISALSAFIFARLAGRCRGGNGRSAARPDRGVRPAGRLRSFPPPAAVNHNQTLTSGIGTLTYGQVIGLPGIFGLSYG